MNKAIINNNPQSVLTFFLLTKNKLFLTTNCLEFNPLMPNEFKLFDDD